jgi:serine/threonine protein kinase
VNVEGHPIAISQRFWSRTISTTRTAWSGNGSSAYLKGVRHNNIKPRNILVKGEEIFFTDFGSSHAFMGEGNSTTEGPSFGHTKMYCAPTVIHQGKRN